MGKCIDCANFISPDVKNMGKTIHCKKFGECSHGAQKYVKCFVGKYDIQSRSRKASEEIVKRIWDGKEDGGVDTCVLAQGGECREGVGACREHVVDAFADLIARSFAEGEE